MKQILTILALALISACGQPQHEPSRPYAESEVTITSPVVTTGVAAVTKQLIDIRALGIELIEEHAAEGMVVAYYVLKGTVDQFEAYESAGYKVEWGDVPHDGVGETTVKAVVETIKNLGGNGG